MNFFMDFLGFVVWQINRHFGGVYQSHYCASHGAFSFVYVVYLNTDSYLYGKQIKSKLGNKLYLWMIFNFVHLNRLELHECRNMILKQHIYPSKLEVGMGDQEESKSRKGIRGNPGFRTDCFIIWEYITIEIILQTSIIVSYSSDLCLLSI